jgi:hypothetical protein
MPSAPNQSQIPDEETDNATAGTLTREKVSLGRCGLKNGRMNGHWRPIELEFISIGGFGLWGLHSAKASACTAHCRFDANRYFSQCTGK